MFKIRVTFEGDSWGEVAENIQSWCPEPAPKTLRSFASTPVEPPFMIAAVEEIEQEAEEAEVSVNKGGRGRRTKRAKKEKPLATLLDEPKATAASGDAVMGQSAVVAAAMRYAEVHGGPSALKKVLIRFGVLKVRDLPPEKHVAFITACAAGPK